MLNGSNNQFNTSPNSAIVNQYKKAEKSGLKVIGTTTGLCILGYIALSNILTLPLAFGTLRDLYKNNILFQNSVVIVLSLITLIVPFYLGGNYIKKKMPCNPLPFDKPYDTKLAIGVIFFGLFICLASNYVAGIWVDFFQKSTGLELTQNEYLTPKGIVDKIYFVITISIVPPLCEEMAIRGAVMQPLRRYGDKFAIVVSAFVFGVLHGNLIQFPFAFLAGLGLGYAVCITGSLWPSIIIHFLNNLLSCITQFMVDGIADKDLLNKAYLILMTVIYGATILGSVFFILIKGQRKLNKLPTVSKNGEKIRAFYINIPMILAMLYMFIATMGSIKK